MRSEGWRRALRSIGLPLAFFGFVAIVLTWPLAARLTTHAAGTTYGDSDEVIRHIWWASEQLAAGRNPFDQPLLAYPTGFTSWLQWTHPLQYLPGALLAFVVSPVAAFNLALLITLTLNGLAAYRLGLTLNGRQSPGALLGGVVFMAFPALQGHLSAGHLGILTLWGAPLFADCLWRVLREGAGWRTAAWGGVWFWLTGLGYVSHITFVLFPIVVFLGLGAWWTGRRSAAGPLRARPWVRAAAMIALGAALLLPFYLPLLSGAGRAELRGVDETGRIRYSADPLAFVSPSPFGPLAQAGVAPEYARRALGVNSIEGSAYLGLAALALAALALARCRAARPWALLALGAMILSLGPLLKWHDAPLALTIEGARTDIVLPWGLLERLPVFSVTRTPGRFNLATALALSALVSLGAGVLLHRAPRAARYAAVALLSGIILLEYALFWPFPAADARLPSIFRELAAAPDVRAVLDVPADDPLAAQAALYQQTLHHRPLVGGHSLRRTLQSPAVLAVLDRAATGAADPLWPPLADETARALLSAAGADRIVLHKRALADPGAAADHLRTLAGPPVYEDAEIAVFALPRADPPLAALSTAGASGGGWRAVDLDGWRGAFLADEGAWFVYLDAGYGELTFDTAAYRVPRRIAVRLDGRLIGGFVASGDPVQFPLWSAPGFHTLRLDALGGCTPFPFELSCLGDAPLDPSCTAVESPACLSAAFSAPQWTALDPPTPAPVALADGLRLRAYTARREGDWLRVRLFWEAAHPLPRDYALFVHVADPLTAEPRAQYDRFPLVPTSAWGGGARWISDAAVDVRDLPPGRYALNVGWFDPDTGARLAVRGGGPLATQGIVALGPVVIEADAAQP